MIPSGQLARISRLKLTGIGRHEGVTFPNGQTLEITEKDGFRVTTVQEFAQNHELKIEHVVHPMHHRDAIERARKLLLEKRPYHFTDFNCEIVARLVTGEPSKSPQITFLVLIVAGVTAWFAFAKVG